MKTDEKNFLRCAFAVIALFMMAVSGCSVPRKPTVIYLGSFAGSAWRVPNPDTYTLYDTAIALFEAANPDIKVVYKSGILRDDYSEWLAASILNEREPDCFFILPEDIHLFADIGILYPLDSFLARSEAVRKCVFFESAMRAGKLNDTQYAVPVEIDPTLMFVNTTLLEKAGIPFPSDSWSWDDFYDICKKVTRDLDGNGTLDQFGVRGFDWTTALYTNRAPLFSFGGKEGLFDSENVYVSFEFLARLNALSGGRKVPEFDNGTVAFNVSSYSWYRAYGYYPYSILKNSKFKWKTTVLPRGPNGKNAAALKVLFMGVSDRSKHKAEALRFLEFFLTDERVQTLYMQRSKGIPVRKDLLETDFVKQILLKDITLAGNEISTETLSRSIDDAMIIPNFRKFGGAVSLVDKDVMSLPENPGQLRNFLSQLNIRVNNYLAK